MSGLGNVVMIEIDHFDRVQVVETIVAIRLGEILLLEYELFLTLMT